MKLPTISNRALLITGLTLALLALALGLAQLAGALKAPKPLEPITCTHDAQEATARTPLCPPSHDRPVLAIWGSSLATASYDGRTWRAHLPGASLTPVPHPITWSELP